MVWNVGLSADAFYMLSYNRSCRIPSGRGLRNTPERMRRRTSIWEISFLPCGKGSRQSSARQDGADGKSGQEEDMGSIVHTANLNPDARGEPDDTGSPVYFRALLRFITF